MLADGEHWGDTACYVANYGNSKRCWSSMLEFNGLGFKRISKASSIKFEEQNQLLGK
jgi:hypothetical protein